MIIGLTGKNGAGKGAVAETLKEMGFIYHSLSDMIRAEFNGAKGPVTRDKLIKAGRKMRADGGPSVLADRLLEKLDMDKNYIVDSIRNPAEALALKKRQWFYLVCVEADQRLRFERTKKRGRENDPKDFGAFVELEKQELGSEDPASQQLEATAKLADVVIENSTSKVELAKKVKQVLKDLNRRETRPNWDEYFMNIAKVVSLRSNCIKRKVASVVVKDQRVISTGYNGTPRGITNCSEGGCPRCNSFGKSGKDLGECLCSHAEENAIVQAAYHGVSIKGATLYSTFSPCLMCTKMVINSGLSEVVYNVDYPLGELSVTLLKEAGVKVRQM